MWSIIKAEYAYHQKLMITLISIIVVLMVVIFGWQWSGVHVDVPGVSTLLALTTGIFWLAWIARMQKEKTTRFHALLPVSLQQLALARMGVIDLFILGLTILMGLGLLVFRASDLQPTVFWYLLSLLALVSAVHALILTMRELLRNQPPRKQQIAIMGLYIVLMITGSIFFATPALLRYFTELPLMWLLPVRLQFSAWIATPAGAISLLLISAVMFSAYIYTYQKLDSYFE